MEKFYQMIGSSQAMQSVYQLILSVAQSDASVLIQGESGTGKELAARAIQQNSSRAHKPFKVLHCGAIPESLIESELFGHVKGSFTSAVQDQAGIFAEADGGTVFLDEIGELSLSAQVKLLRILQSGEYHPIGSQQSRHSDVRVIAATHRDLKLMIEQGTFREDLFYRLYVVGILLPPLRERQEDIPTLATYFLEKSCEKLHKQTPSIAAETLKVLCQHIWTGNIRELENVMERCAVLVQKDTLTLEDLPAQFQANLGDHAGDHAAPTSWSQEDYRRAKTKALQWFNQYYMNEVLRKTRGNISRASEFAGMDRSNFKKLIRKYHIDPIQFKAQMAQKNS